MTPFWNRMSVLLGVGLVIASGLLFAGDQFETQESERHPVSERSTNPLGAELFADVISVHFIGPGHPANADGTLGGLVAEESSRMTIYEHYIVIDVIEGETIQRTLHAYETLGRIVQRITPASAVPPRI